MPKPINYRAKKPPTITLIIPTHKRPHLLARNLRSIAEQAPREELQCIVVADEADADTAAVCTALLTPNDMFIRRSPCTPGESRNSGMLHAEGRYIMFLDDDDLWHPNCLAAMLQQPVIQAGRLAYFNCSRVVERRVNGIPEPIQEDALHLENQINEMIYVRNQIHMSCIAFPREMIRNFTFDPRLRTFEDWDFILSVFEQEMPRHVPVMVSRVCEVYGDDTDRLSSGNPDLGTVIDYLYIYRRHVIDNNEIRELRSTMLKTHDLVVDPQFL
jgi:GalNAc5-diNAcBac-PP-undecaprenol beta-1,3-glucosyltransferase